MRHPGFGTIGNPPDRDPVRPTSDTRPSTLDPDQVIWIADVVLAHRWFGYHIEWEDDRTRTIWDCRCGYSGTGGTEHLIEQLKLAAPLVTRYSHLLEERPKVAPESEPLEGIEQYQAEDR